MTRTLIVTLSLALALAVGCKSEQEEKARQEAADHLRKAQTFAASDDPAQWALAESQANAAKNTGDKAIVDGANAVLEQVSAKKAKAKNTAPTVKKVCPPGVPLCD